MAGAGTLESPRGEEAADARHAGASAVLGTGMGIKACAET